MVMKMNSLWYWGPGIIPFHEAHNHEGYDLRIHAFLSNPIGQKKESMTLFEGILHNES
jgi:hypothetical protein